MNILLTGGAGYLGCHALRRLLALGHRVVVVDDCRSGHAELLRAASEVADDRAQVVPVSIADRLVANALNKYHIDSVVHLAADIDAGESIDDPMRYYRNNVSNALALLDTVLAAGIHRFVFASSAAVYGDAGGRLPIDEKQPRAPVTPFGRSKMMFEMALEDAAAATGLGYAILRLFTVAGAAADTTLGEWRAVDTGLVPRALAAADANLPLPVYGTDLPTRDGTAVRDFVHVEDVADAIVAALNTLMPTQSLVYNVGSGTGASVYDVVAQCEAVADLPIATLADPRRAGEPATQVANIAKIRAELGWSPRADGLRPMIESAWAWHQRRQQAARAALPSANAGTIDAVSATA